MTFSLDFKELCYLLINFLFFECGSKFNKEIRGPVLMFWFFGCEGLCCCTC